MNAAEQFEAIVSEYYQPLFLFAMSLTRVEDEARELTQQTFCIWATKGHQLRDPSKVKTWLFTTLHRAFLQVRRRENRFSHFELETVVEELPAHSVNLTDQMDSHRVLSALAQVDEVYRVLPVALYYLEDCSQKEIAEILGVPLGTVKSRIARGIKQLRDIFLTGTSPDLSPAENETTSFLKANLPMKPSPAVPPRSSRRALVTGAVRWAFGKWNFSATPLVEPLGA